MKCNLITPAHERKASLFKKIYRKTAVHSRGIEVLESRIAPATFFVSNANDSGIGSLRQAILDANSTPNSGGADLISFASIPTGMFVIQPITELPAISEAVIIDGYTAPGTSQNTLPVGTNAVLRVELNGSLLNSGSGLILGVAGGDADATGGSTVRGLVINDFHPGINDSGNGILIHSNDNKVEGNFLGTATTGNAAFGNSNSGVSVSHFGGSDTYTNNVIGGPSLADRNLISGNTLGISLRAASMNTLIIGNLIGTDNTGLSAIPNTNAGILVGGDGTVIGGATPDMANVISGNGGPGVGIGTSNNTTLLGNIIGLNATGTLALGNAGPGILMNNSGTNITIGGSGTGVGNVISGNNEAGIEIGSSVGDGPANNVTVRGNKIGTDVSGTLKLGNQNGGIKVFGSMGSTIGGTSPLDGNVIAFNSNSAGISVREDAGTSSVAILGNSIFGNSRLGIDLGAGKENFFGVTENDNFDADQGPNGLINSPTLTTYNNTGTDVMLNFSVSAQPNTNYRIEFFSLAPAQVDLSGSGEGVVFLGSQDVNTNGAGQFFGNYAQTIGLPADSYFTATLTDTGAGQTSEFSNAMGAAATTYTWNGAQSSEWFNPLNWAPNGVPGPFDTAIYNGGTNPIQLNSDASVLVFQHSAGSMLGAGKLFVRNSLTWTGGSQDGPGLILTDGATGSFNSGAGPLVWSSGNFTIAGALTLAGSGLAFNSGMLDVNATGALTLNAGIIDQDGAISPSRLTNAGKIEKFGTGVFGLETTTVLNGGSIESHAGSLKLAGYTGLSGSKLGLTGGNIQTTGTLTLDTDGELFGTGTITGNLFNNGGYVYVGVGEVTGVLNLTGNYTQTPSGTLAVDLRGTTPGANYDQFAIGGTASINGTLNVTILPGYTPALGQTLNVLTSSGLAGTFSAVVGEGALVPNYTSTNMQLVRNGLTYTWDAGGGADTSWFNPLNWAPDGLPGAGDVAMLNTNATITLDTADVSVGDFIQSNGTLTGSKELNIVGSFSWTGGTQTGTGSTHPGTESSTVFNGAVKTLETRTLFLQGSAVANGASPIVLNNSSKVQIGGLFEVLNATPFQSGGSGGVIEVRPEGTLRKPSVGAASISAGLTLTNNGLLDVQNGTLNIVADGTANGATFRVTPGNTINFNSSTAFGFANSVLFEGGGTAALIGGSLSGASTTVVNVAANTTFAISGGTFALNTGTFVSNGSLQWSGGSLTGGGTFGINGQFDISGSAVKTLSQTVLNIAPTSSGTWNGTGNISVLQNAAINIGGTVQILSSLDVLDGDSSGSVLSVFPTGNFNKDGAGTTDIQLAINSDGFVTSINSGTLQLSSTFTQNSGLLSVGSGSFIAATNPLQIQGGYVVGDGTITGSVNNTSGHLTPGNISNPIGTLTITGNYTQASGGELLIEAGGTAPGTGYDQLIVGGAVTLDGKLLFQRINSYNPVAPAAFGLITSTGALTGTFSTINPPTSASVSYTANSATLVFSASDLLVNGTTGDDTLVLSVQSTVAGYTLNGGAFTPLGTVPGFIFNGGAGNDILIIDFANGNPIPATNGVFYDGQGESGGFDDKLMITGGAQGTVNYNFVNANDGNVVMSNFGTVNFTSLTPISNTGGATNVIFNLPATTNNATLGDDGNISNTLSRLSGATFPQLDFANPSNSLTINRGSVGDTLTINALPDFNASLTIGAAASPFGVLTFAGAVTLAANKNLTADASGTITFASANADLSASGTGAISLTTARDFNMFAATGWSVTTTNGDITLNANQQTTQTTGSFYGVQASDGLIEATGSGNIVINARGGIIGAANFVVGLAIDPNTTVRTNTGSITMSGVGGQSGASGNNGIQVHSGSVVESTGGGSIDLTGIGGLTSGAGQAQIGIRVLLGGTVRTTGTGTITLTGTGGAVSAASDNYGVRIDNAGAVTSSGSGTITINSTGGANNAPAFRTDTGTNRIGFDGTNTYTGNIIINADSMDITGADIQTTGTATLRQKTNGTQINLGGADSASTLGLTDAELDQITAGTVQIGDANSGAITLSAALTHANNLSLTTGAGVSGASTLTLSAGKNLGVTANGTIVLSGAITVPGTTTLAAGAANDITLTNAGNSLATVSIISGATVSLLDDGGFDLGAANISTLFSLESAGAITQSGVLSGTGALMKLGTGTLTLSSANTYSGATTVSAGTLIVNGSLANGNAAVDVVVFSGATLSGIGTIGGSVSNSGTVEPGGSGTAGTLTISGNFTQDASGTLIMDIGGVSAAQFDALDVGGTATLDGLIDVNNTNGFIPAGGSSFTLISATSVTGGFNTVSATGYTADQTAMAFDVIANSPTVVVPKDPFTFTDQNGDTVKVALTGKGRVNVLLQGGVSDNADIASIELIDTDLTSKLNVVITSKPIFDRSYDTDIGRIFTSGALQHVGSITLGSNVFLGDGVADAVPELRVTGKMNTLVLGNLLQNTYIKLGEALPYDLPGTKTPDTYNNRPSLTVGRVLGPGVNIEVLGDGTPGGVGGGGFSKVVVNSWAFNGYIRTTQGIGSFLVQNGDFYGVLEVDKFSNGSQTTANVGSMTIAQGAWGSSGSEIEGSVGTFNAAAFLAGATITAGSIGSVKTTGALAGTFILTDPDAAAVPTFTVNSDFTGRVVSATSIKKLNIKGDFTGSLEAPSIGSITAFAFLGTAGMTDITTTAGKLGLLTSTAGIIRDYTIVSDAAFSGFKVKLGKLSSSTVGIDNVHVTATSIGAINVDLTALKGSSGVDLTGIRNSTFTTTATGIAKGTTGSIGKITVKLKGGTAGDGTGITNSSFDARVLANEFGMGLPPSAVNPIGNVLVNLSGFGGASVGMDDADFEGNVLGTTTVTVTRGIGASTARGVDGATFTATGAIGALSFSGDVTANMITDMQVLAGGKVGAVKVAAKSSAFGSLVDSAILAGQSLSVEGTEKQQKAALTAASLGAVSIGGSLTNSKLVAGSNIGAVKVGANATDALILAGAKLGGDFTLGDNNETFQRAAAITSVTVGGAFTRSSIVAGIASTNATFGDADDALAAVAGTLVQSSSIGALKVGAGSGTNVAGSTIPHAFAIQAAAIKSLANATSTLVKDFTAALFLDTGAANEDANDVLVRLI